MRAALPALVALLLLGAGCVGVLPAGDSPDYVAPGLARERLVDPAALADAHAARLRNGSFAVVRNYTQRIPAHDGYAITHDESVRVGPEWERFSYRHRVVARRNGTTERRTWVWSDGETVLVRRENGTGVSYERHDADAFAYGPTNLTYAWAVRDLHALNATARINRSGVALYRLAGRGEREGPRNETWEETALVAETGLVHRLDTAGAFDTRLGRAHVDRRLRWRAGNATVARPPWVAAARANTTAKRASRRGGHLCRRRPKPGA